MEAPFNLCITCNRDSAGRTHIKTMDLYSSVCAVQNLWLAARAEGLGVGWVSILGQRQLQNVLQIPHGIIPIAYLCIGYVGYFHKKPELENAGWLPRRALSELIYFDEWENRAGEREPLIDQIEKDRDLPALF